MILAGLFMLLVTQSGIVMKSAALLVFLIASLTDYLDGHIARQKGEITNFGKLMDPIADKLLSLSAFVGFVQMGIIPAWMVVAVITRDLLVTGFRFLLPEGTESQAPRSSGKHKTALQFAAIVGVLVFLVVRETSVWSVQWTPVALQFIYATMLFIVLLTLWSGIRYVVKNQELLDEFMG